MKRVLFLVVFIMPVVAFSQDIPSLIYKIALSTDMFQSEQWFYATKKNPMITPSGHQAWEGNPLVAGRSREHFVAYNYFMYCLPDIVDHFIHDKALNITLKSLIALREVYSPIKNHFLLQQRGFEKRFMIHISFPI